MDKIDGNERKILEMYREAVMIDVKMNGPVFMGCNQSALKRAWLADDALVTSMANINGGFGLIRPIHFYQMMGWKFSVGDHVRKNSGSWWEGKICGFYSTDQSPQGYCVQLCKPNGPVQIYPEAALEIPPNYPEATL